MGARAGIFQRSKRTATIALHPFPLQWCHARRNQPRTGDDFLRLQTVIAAAGDWRNSGRQRTEYFWRNPIAGAHFQTVTDFEEWRRPRVIRDGHFVAVSVDRDATMGRWVTQAGSGEFHNLTRGERARNRQSIGRTWGSRPDGSLVTSGSQEGWSERRRHWYLVGANVGAAEAIPEGVAVSNGRMKVPDLRTTPGPGDICLCQTETGDREGPPISQRLPGLHCHFRCGRLRAFIYFVQAPYQTNWTFGASPQPGGSPERITSTSARVGLIGPIGSAYVMYLASDRWSGPWLYSVDVERRISHRLQLWADRYTSLEASADGIG